MQPVARESILDYVTYEARREEIRRRVFAVKALRRIHAAGVLTFLFENTETVRYQVQEMVRAERLVAEADVRHELETYNELLAGPGGLGCTLLIEIEDPEERRAKLAAWIELPRHVYVRVGNGSGAGEKVYARFDRRQIGADRLSSVHYLAFDTAGRTPFAVGVDLPGMEGETELTAAQRAALAEDLGS